MSSSEPTKRCTTCGEDKPLDEFYVQTARRDGKNPSCKPCVKAYQARRWREVMAPDPAVRAKRADAWLLHRYGLTREDYDRMLAEQGGGCATCGTTDPGAKAFHVDHDHATGQVRGLLCSPCNVVLGHVKDDPMLRELADYLERVRADVQF